MDETADIIADNHEPPQPTFTPGMLVQVIGPDGSLVPESWIQRDINSIRIVPPDGEEPEFISLTQLQNEVGPYVARNFPAADNADHPALGIIEECGEFASAHLLTLELLAGKDADVTDKIVFAAMSWMGKLAHHRLKELQGIRGSAEEHQSKARVASTHLINCLYTLFGAHHVDLAFQAASQSKGVMFNRKVDTTEDAMADIIVYAADYCSRTGKNLAKAVSQSWRMVRKRDFKADPQSGGQP